MDYPVQFVDQLKPHLRSLRKVRGLTQGQLAKKLDVVQSRVAALEGKPEAMSVDQLFRLLAVLGVQVVLRDISDLHKGGTDEPTRANDLPKGAW